MISFDELLNLQECPLCEKIVEREYLDPFSDGAKKITCKNNCLKIIVDGSGINCHIRIFNAKMMEDQFLHVMNGTNEFKRFKKRLFYWKENDRYLAEILEGN